MQQRYYDPVIGRLLSVDPVTAYDNAFSNFNRYVYALNNPYRFTDPDGRDPCCDQGPVTSFSDFGSRMWESAKAGFPTTAGQALAADAAYITGVATGDENLQAAAIEGMQANVTTGDGISAAMMAVSPRGEAGIEGGAGKGTGTYTNEHASGMRYHGKGSEARMRASAAAKAKANNDPVVSKSHTPAANAREAFKEEARRIAADGGPGKGNYNKIQSPGKKYLEEDK